jgi:hypothetical protein
VNLYGFVGNRGEGWIDVLGRNVYAIDGTHANVNEVGAKWTYTNVADFVERVKLVGKEKASYYGGPGVRKNRNTPIGKTYHGITGAETYDIAREVKTQICQDLVRADNQNIDFVINLVAWSRGAVAAIWVAQMLEKEGCPCNGGTTFPRVNFLGLYDSVEMVFLPSDAPPLPFLFPATVGLQLLPDQPPPPGSIPSNVDHFFHAMKTGPSLIPGQVPLPTKRYGRAEEIAFPLRHPDPSSLSTHGDIGVDPYSTDAHTAMILRARGFGVSIDIFNLYNHYPRTSL